MNKLKIINSHGQKHKKKRGTLAISQWLPKIFNQKKPQPKNALKFLNSTSDVHNMPWAMAQHKELCCPLQVKKQLQHTEHFFSEAKALI